MSADLPTETSSRLYALTVPKWGIEMEEGTVISWEKQPGDAIEKGAGVLEMETDKITNDVESPSAGVLLTALAAEGDTLKVGALLGVIGEADTAADEIQAFIDRFVPVDAGFEDGEPATPAASEPPAQPAATVGGPQKVSPIARKLADQLGVDLTGIQGTGRNNRVSKADVETAAAAQGLMSGSKPVAFRDSPIPARRLTIARKLTEAKQAIPHYYLSRSIDATAMLQRKPLLSEAGVTFNHMIIEGCATALMSTPELNIQVLGETVRTFEHANIAIAVDSDRGLITPVLKAADKLTIEEIASSARDLAARASAGSLERDDLEDGSFSISNLGMLGVDSFTAIINPPQGAILAIGAMRPSDLGHGSAFNVTLSCDHRVIDGATGARFLQRFAQAVESGATAS